MFANKMHLKIKLFLLPKDLGGRRSPVFYGYRADWSFRSDKTLNGAVIKTIASTTTINPGETEEALIYPLVKNLWAEVAVGQQLRLCEGARVVGIASVLEIIDGD